MSNQQQNKGEILYVWKGEDVAALKQDIASLANLISRIFPAFWAFRQEVGPDQEPEPKVEEKKEEPKEKEQEEKKFPEIKEKSLNELAAENPEIEKIKQWIISEVKECEINIVRWQDGRLNVFEQRIESLERKNEMYSPDMAALMTVKEAAEYAGVHRNTIYRWCSKGLPYTGNAFITWKLKKSDLDEWLEEKKKKWRVEVEDGSPD